MSKNIIRRAHDDPMWSGRLVEGSHGGWDYSECTLAGVANTLVDAGDALCDIWEAGKETSSEELEGRGVVDIEHAPAMAVVFELIDNIQRHLPWVMGWCVTYTYADGGKEVRTAHLTEEHARTFIPWSLTSTSGKWSVERRPAPILAFVHPDATPGQVPPGW